MGRMDITHRFVDQATDAFNRLDLDITTVGALLANSGPHIRVKAYELATEIIRCLAIAYDTDMFDGSDDDETRALIRSRQLMDVLDPDEDED